jgi:hypothetical protein
MVYAKSQGAYLGNVCIPSWTKFSTLVTLELHAMKIARFLGKNTSYTTHHLTKSGQNEQMPVKIFTF